MAEIFSPGFVGLRDWIGRETGLRFGAENSSDAEKRASIFDEACGRLYREWKTQWARAWMPDGKNAPVPAEVWMRPEAERQKILATGQIDKFWHDWSHHYAGRVAVSERFTLVPVVVKQETEFERITRQARAQASSSSISHLAGGPPDLTPPRTVTGLRAPWPSQRNQSRPQTAGGRPIIDVPADEPAKRPKPLKPVQKREVSEFLTRYTASFNGGPKPTIDGLIAAAKEKLGYTPARERITEWLDDPKHQHLKREPGDKPLKPKPIAQ